MGTKRKFTPEERLTWSGNICKAWKPVRSSPASPPRRKTPASRTFHSIVDREVIQRFEFSSYYEAKITFEAHLQWYNHERKHGQLGRITQQKWDGYEKKKLIENIIFALRGKAEAGAAGEQPARNNPASGDDAEGMTQTFLPFHPHLCCKCLQKLMAQKRKQT